jgi:F-type H+-transporting ATPase subunit delta
LDGAQQEQVTSRLSGIYGDGLSFEFMQDPELLGGLRIRVGSDVYDGSVEARLEALEQSF